MEEENKSNIDDLILNDKREFKVPESDNKEKNNNLIYIFLFTFIAGIIFVSVFLKGITPNIDLDIGENPVAAMNQRGDDENFNVRAQIDQRLKMIQNDDEMPGVSERNDFETPEDIIKRLRGETVNSKNIEKENNEEKNDITIEPVRVQMQDIQPAVTVTKIYIGQFSTMEKALEMQDAVISSDVNVNPIIRTVNGYYTIQVGAFSSYDSAKSLANQLTNAGFAAKLVKELK